MPPANFFLGWVIVIASFIVLTVAYGLQFSYGIFLPFIADDLGLSRATATAPLSLYILTYSLLTFATGPLTDKLGPRKVVLAGGFLLGLGYLLLSSVSSTWQIFASFSLVAGLGMSATFIPLNATVVRWFIKRRGLALAITGSGVNAAAVVGPMSAAVLIPLLGWRASLMVLGLVGGLIILGSALALVRDPESRNLRPDGDVESPQRGDSENTLLQEVSWTLDEARSVAAFWIIMGVFFLSWMMLFFPYAHLPALASDLGHGSTIAASLIGAMGVGGFGGRMVIGWSSDTIGRSNGLYIALGAQVLGCLNFALTDSLALLYLAALVFGAGAGAAITLFPAIIGDLFGRAHVGAISGFIFAIASSASAIGPYIGGLIKDTTGTYLMAFLAGAILNVTAIFLVTRIQKPQK
jgi:MFS family permease